ncbi:hypothetical protein BDY19DRAFT_990412 [Irpex rosettiformis]|uniref:Uncharacterized protein n=1 Tax=Irpex rosettiformis TaxID=378272 RepID=A0ACB8UEK7_9APHY|nr:hypothetical protein BDY19DRAFT_990412 [Irpex rosettiformis]
MATPFSVLPPPPLPPGWTEHLGPNGQPYYYNAPTQQSTYIRPLPNFPAFQAGAVPPPPPPQPQTQQKKEKPLVKTPIPGTEWLRVKTTEGNIFYTHKGRKESVWVVPEEIRDGVEALEKREDEERRVRAKAEEEKRVEQAKEAKAAKRKAEETMPVEEVVISKKAKVEDEEEDSDEDDEDEDESEEEEWQREAAAQLAAEAEEEKKRQEEELKRLEEEEKARKAAEAEALKNKPLNMPERVDLSLDEAKALFKTLLREKDVNPLHPWDTSLPLFISDPRYVLLPSVSARKEAFDEYCRDRARELRQSQVKKDKHTLSPKEDYDKLLHDEVKSTRASWTEFRRQWKKDRKFYGWGKDDREREKRFRDYLKELGEKKRAAAQKAEVDFFALLKESGIAKAGAVWKDVKKGITSDPRYDAVGSSSLREELFHTYLKANGAVSTTADEGTKSDVDQAVKSESKATEEEDEIEKDRRRKERKERAVKEREEKIQAERTKVNADIDRSRSGLNKGEAELEFRTMLTDAIRDPQVTWDSILPQLKTDPRFTRSVLPLNQQLHIFHSHITNLRSKHLTSLHALFESHAPSLATPFTSLPVTTLLASLPATKLGYDIQGLEDEYEKWQRLRTQDARRAFDEMLGENAFVEFWGRLGKIGGKGVDEGIRADDIGEDEEQLVDMKALAKTVDLKEMIKVLKNDKRYLVFDHVPEQRERWLRDYLSQLSAPKLSVHAP